MASDTSEGLPRARRVRRRPDFERGYNTGLRLHGRFMTIFVVATGAHAARLGVSASRKLGSAVTRNKAKRLARELFRRHRVAAGIDVIVVPRREMLDAPFSSLEADYLALLARRDRSHPSPGPRPNRASRGRGARSAPRV
jgi:ribonuclease P protein component